MTDQTLGQKRVIATFNPSGDGYVDTLKARAAELIDICENARRNASNGEETRLWALAQTHFEEAAMWAVKAATFSLP